MHDRTLLTHLQEGGVVRFLQHLDTELQQPSGAVQQRCAVRHLLLQGHDLDLALLVHADQQLLLPALDELHERIALSDDGLLELRAVSL